MPYYISKTKYGMEIYGSCSSTNIEEIQIMQHSPRQMSFI